MIGDYLQLPLVTIIAPQSRVQWDEYMSKFNWRSSSEFYKRVEGAEITGLAWECLRRNPAFQRAQQAAPPPGVSASIEFRQQWGLVFRS
jgi:hypothetical protein